MRRKLAYIVCLPHTGSTLLNLLLGQHPNMIGLGGIDREMTWIERAPDEAAARTCGCGATVAQCPYWSEVLAGARARPTRNVAERYDLALEVFTRVFGPETWPVDASQIREVLGTLAEQPDLDTRALFLVRDFRSAVVSIVDLKRGKKLLSRPRFLLAMEAALRWRRENGRIASALHQIRSPVLGVGYEEFCLRFQATFARICDFLELPPYPPTLEVHAGRNHAFVGNVMRRTPSKAQVNYDYRWMTRTDWWLPGLLLPGLLRCNREWVYPSGRDEIFSAERSAPIARTQPAH